MSENEPEHTLKLTSAIRHMINNIAYESTVFVSLTNEVVTQTLFTSLATLILIFVMTMNRHGSVTRWSHVAGRAGGPGWRDS